MTESILSKIITTKPSAPRITIYGKPGIGKSTLASHFPDPLFLLTEDNELPGIKALPIALSFNELWSNIKSLLALDELPFKTIVVDSISKLDHLLIQYILEKEKPNKHGEKVTNIAAACGGYGAGYLAAQSLHRAFKDLMDKFKEKGIGVVYISHLAHSSVKPPDNEDYTTYTIVMNHDKSREIYIDDVDAVLFCRLRTFTTETESGRNLVKNSDERIILSGISDSHVSKNRYAMPVQMPMSFEEIKKYIPFYNQLNEE